MNDREAERKMPAEPYENESPDEADGANPGWYDIAAQDAVPEGKGLEVLVGGEIVAIFRFEGTLYALDGMCAHQGGPLASGSVAHGCVTCPWHGWQYELKTGIQTVNRQPLQRTYPVRERNGRVEVQLRRE